MKRIAGSVRFFLLAAILALAPATTTAARYAPPSLTRSQDGPVFVETLRIVTDYLNDPTNGVNAMLATLPHDVGDTLQTVQAIVDETRNGVAARERFPQPTTPGPVITVSIVKPATVHTSLDDAYRDCDDVPVAIRYADVNDVASETGTMQAMYAMRAVLKSMKRLMSGPPGPRQRNSVELANVHDDVTMVPTFQDIEDKVVTGGLVFHFYVRDMAP